MGKPSDLVQGTLDLLILRTLVNEPCTVGPSASASNCSPAKSSRSSKARFIPLCIASSSRPGYLPTGSKAKPAEPPNYYSLTDAGRQKLDTEQANWNRLSAAIDLVLEGA